MNANEIINPEMSLEEKLKAIDEAMREQELVENEKRASFGLPPIDPAELTICEGCQ
jgi:hypothetical protein